MRDEQETTKWPRNNRRNDNEPELQNKEWYRPTPTQRGWQQKDDNKEHDMTKHRQQWQKNPQAMTTNDDKKPRHIQNERQHTANAYTRTLDYNTSRRYQMITHQKATTDRTKNKRQEKHKTQNTKKDLDQKGFGSWNFFVLKFLCLEISLSWNFFVLKFLSNFFVISTFNFCIWISFLFLVQKKNLLCTSCMWTREGELASSNFVSLTVVVSLLLPLCLLNLNLNFLFTGHVFVFWEEKNGQWKHSRPVSVGVRIRDRDRVRLGPKRSCLMSLSYICYLVLSCFAFRLCCLILCVCRLSDFVLSVLSCLALCWLSCLVFILPCFVSCYVVLSCVILSYVALYCLVL